MDALPYCGAPALPDEIWLRWNFDPALLAVMACFCFGHSMIARPWHPGRAAAFVAGWGLLAVIFISPFCALASALFSARAGHHMILVALVPPLLVLAVPRGPWRGRSIVGAGMLSIAHALVLWAWHVPAVYALALADPRFYWLMQATLFGSALLLWRALLAPATNPGAALAALAGTLAQTGLLGAILAFARAPLYGFHLATTWPWGLSPLADQQLAGALMWAAGALPYLAATLLIVALRLAPSAAEGARGGAR